MKQFSLVAVLQLFLVINGYSVTTPQSLIEEFGFQANGSVEDSRDCTDFSGVWKGSCTIVEKQNGQSSERTRLDTIVIKQNGCKSITTDGITSPFGGSTTLSMVLPNSESLLVNVYLDWDADRKSANERFALGARRRRGASGVETLSGNETINLDNGNLVIIDDQSWTADSVKGESVTTVSKKTCNYTIFP